MGVLITVGKIARVCLSPATFLPAARAAGNRVGLAFLAWGNLHIFCHAVLWHLPSADPASFPKSFPYRIIALKCRMDGQVSTGIASSNTWMTAQTTRGCFLVCLFVCVFGGRGRVVCGFYVGLVFLLCLGRLYVFLKVTRKSECRWEWDTWLQQPKFIIHL